VQLKINSRKLPLIQVSMSQSQLVARFVEES